jgi:alanyl-tRNA synthetase
MPLQTERLYHSDPYLREFRAAVLEVQNASGKCGVILDRTCFYPEGGGQPSDRGTLNGAAVTSVVEVDGGIVHFTEGLFNTGETVKGVLDWNRRFDHMQQHSGQHILSQAFNGVYDAKTLSFHLGAESTTIDLGIADLSEEDARKAEVEANRILNEDRIVHVYHRSVDQLESIPLRKRPDIPGDTARIVEVEDFDWSLCCGTHVKHTGEVGIIKLTGWEKYKGGLRLHFLCGARALRDFQAKNDIVKSLVRTLTVGESELAERVSRLKDECKALEKRNQVLLVQVIDAEAQKLLQKSKDFGSVKLASAFLGNRDSREVRELVKKLASFEGVVVVIGAVHDRASLFLARSEKLGYDVRPALQAAMHVMNAAGGGSPNWAQCSTGDTDKIEKGMKKAIEVIESSIGPSAFLPS